MLNQVKTAEEFIAAWEEEHRVKLNGRQRKKARLAWEAGLRAGLALREQRDRAMLTALGIKT